MISGRVLTRTEVGQPGREPARSLEVCLALLQGHRVGYWPPTGLDDRWLVVSSPAQRADPKHLAPGRRRLFPGSCPRAGPPPPRRRAARGTRVFPSGPLRTRAALTRSQAAAGDAGRGVFLLVRRLTAVGTLTLPGGVLKGRGWARFSSAGAHLPLAPGPPLPRLARHHSQSILTPPSSVPAAWAPASCVFLGMLGNSAKTKAIPSEFAGRAGTGQITRAAGLDCNPLQPARRSQLCR